MNAEESYLWDQIKQHILRFFAVDSQEYIKATKIVFGPYNDVVLLREKAIAIPSDVPSSIIPCDYYSAAFNGTNVTLWNKLPKPAGNEWICLPDTRNPLWYQHKRGTLIPAWNLFSTLFGLLTFREEMELPTRDYHGRFAAVMSPRHDAGLLECPAFNESAALLLAACVGLKHNTPPVHQLDKLVKPPVILLSHDVDVLEGDDFWTQVIRFYRILAPMIRMKLPHIVNLKWMLKNLITPRKYYFHDITRMINIEKKYQITSSFYFLNGKKGRFGARSGAKIIQEAIGKIPEQWNIGIHYNYDTFCHKERFGKQMDELTNIIHAKPISGRGHYLRFDAGKSFEFLDEQGIKCDETAGYADKIGYRCGIAGPFQPFDAKQKKAMNLWEMPLIVMEGTLIDQYKGKAVVAFSKILHHLCKIGGAVSVLFHPGLYCNPEFPEAIGLYDALLAEANRFQARGMSCRDFLEF